MGLYPESSVERKTNVIIMEDDSTPISDEKKIRDPLGLYTEDTPERQEGLVVQQEVESLASEDKRAVYDPLGLYPPNAPEREEGLIEPLEVVPHVGGIVTDPLNLYQEKSEIDTNTEMSPSLPFLRRPKMLDGTLPGDRGFDPFNFASDANRLEWYRSAEIRHCRLAMLAVVGWPISELMDEKLADAFGLNPLVDLDDRVPSVLNGGLGETPLGFWILAAVMTTAIEIVDIMKYNNAKEQGNKFIPGDLGFDPLNLFGKTEEERMFKQEAELFNGRLSMLAVTGFAIQEWWTQNAVINETPAFFKPFFFG